MERADPTSKVVKEAPVFSDKDPETMRLGTLKANQDVRA
jgi:hypothetical protein